MARILREIVYIDKDPDDPYKGWHWVEIEVEIYKKFSLSRFPESYRNRVHDPKIGYRKYPNNGNLPSKGRSGTKKFTLNMNGELISIRPHKSLTIKAVFAWVKTWASPDAQLITPEGRVYSIHSSAPKRVAYFVYFILNEDSHAIKIGQAKNVERRLKTLQTSSPAKLKLIKSIQVNGKDEATELEKNLHRKFEHIRLNGEWFQAVDELQKFIEEQSALTNKGSC